jgi:hypothetical protein
MFKVERRIFQNSWRRACCTYILGKVVQAQARGQRPFLQNSQRILREESHIKITSAVFATFSFLLEACASGDVSGLFRPASCDDGCSFVRCCLKWACASADELPSPRKLACDEGEMARRHRVALESWVWTEAI